MRLATQKEKFALLGPPGDHKRQGICKIPMKLKLSWKLGYNLTQFQCHIMLIPHFLQVYKKLSKLDKSIIIASGMDIWGGCYNYRPIRGTELQLSPPFSAHSWGAAIDHDPVRNGLHTKAPKANLSHPYFDQIHDIWAQHGFINMGHVIGRDYMHYEASFELISNPSKFL